MDESTDVASPARLGVSVRFSGDNILKGELIKLMLSNETTGQVTINETKKNLAKWKLILKLLCL
jgi:hypothetical protein